MRTARDERSGARQRSASLGDRAYASVRAPTRALRSILQSISEGVVVTNAQGAFLLFNRAAEEMLGVGPVDGPPAAWPGAYGLFLPDRVTPYPAGQLPLARAIRGEAVREAEVFVRNPRRPEGAMISVSATPWTNASGALLGGIAVLRDITARKEADDAIRRLSNAVEQTADSVMITDRSGVIEYVNPGFERMTGYSRDEALGQTPRLLKSGQHDAAHYREMWGTILAGQVYRGTMVNRRKSGELFYVEITTTPIKDPGGNFTHFVAVGKDMTDRRKRVEQELELDIARSVQQRLFPARAPELQGFDIAGVSHPATTMCGDYFDYLAMPGDRLGIVIGDVSGHGLGPALVMAQTRAYLRASLRAHPDPGAVLRALNESLLADLEDGHFVTMLLASVDAGTRQLTYANAGHPAGYVLAGSGETKSVLDSSGHPLGLFPKCGVTSGPPLLLEPGDIVLLLTDGITESQAPDGSFLGTEGALDLVRAHRAGTAREMLEGLIAGVQAFARDRPQDDDLTAVVCKVAAAR